MPDNRTNIISGLAEIVDQYDGFIIDQFGVLHNGSRAYAGSIDCLKKLAGLNKTVVMLTNSGKSAAANLERMQSMGFDERMFAAVVTSGEAASKFFAQREGTFFKKLGRRAFMTGGAGNYSILSEHDYELVNKIEQADFILLAGVEEDKQASFYEDLLSHGVKQKLPLICANPDQLRLTQGGMKASCGAYAMRYEQLGGRVVYFGKPHPEIYDACLSHLTECESNRILAVGDSLEHDIAGAARIGIDTLFISCGIHKDDFSDTTSDQARQKRLAEINQHRNATPIWMSEAFRW